MVGARGGGRASERPGRATRRSDRHPAPRRRSGASVWVDASAGTGKTKVLSDRVLRLLLAGTRRDASSA